LEIELLAFPLMMFEQEKDARSAGFCFIFSNERRSVGGEG